MPDIEVSQIRSNEVSTDGRFARVACKNDADDEFNMVIPTDAILDLITNLQLIYSSAKLTRETSRPVQVPRVDFGEAEPMFIVTTLGGAVRPNGHVELRVGHAFGPTFQLSIPKAQSQGLYDLLLQVFAEDDDKPN